MKTCVGQRRPDFTLADTDGSPVSAADFDGQLLLVNFWATWCAPCVEEMPMLSRLQAGLRQAGLQVVGIALDDPERRASLQTDWHSHIRSWSVSRRGAGRAPYGNSAGMLPYSVLVDAEGIIRWTHLGALDRENWNSKFSPC